MFEYFTEHDEKPSIVDCIVKADALDLHPLGIIALNGDCYTKFSELFEPIIKEIHGLDDNIEKHPDLNWGDGSQLEALNSDRIVSIEISCSRSLTGFNFICGMNEQDLENVLTTVSSIFVTMLLWFEMECSDFRCKMQFNRIVRAMRK